MMAYHQRVNQFKSRIDFDDPSTTKPPSLAKSAVLQALEEEERQQQGRGKGIFQLQPSRQSRSRQREPVPERARTPCINRDTVLRINRRPVRHRSCDSFWPPAQGRGRSPSPRTNLGGTEGGSFAYDVGSYGHYGSHESVYFDERVRKQHKIDPLRTMFDKANVVLVDWGGRNRGAGTAAQPSSRLSDNGVYDRRCQEEEKVVGDDDAGNNFVKQGEMIESEAKPPTPDVAPPPPPPPLPPPRKYFLPMEQLQSGVGIEILLRCYGGEGPPASLNRSESQEISTFKIDDGIDSRQQAKQPPPAAGFPAFTEDRTLHQDGIQSKPPLKSRATPTKRFPNKPPTPPTNFPVNHSDDPSTTGRDEFNINSNTILNLNIDNNLASTTVPRITVTDCPQNQQQHQQGATSKTNDQLWHEIIDENHNYNEKLITNSSGTRPEPVAQFDFDDDPPHLPNEQHSKLNVSNQPNRNWINLNSNEIYPHSAAVDAPPAAARVTTTIARVPNPNDDPQQQQQQQQAPPNPTNPHPDNCDNKSIKSNYRTGGGDGQDSPRSSRLRRSESRDSSWRVDQLLEFPPPPPYACDCDELSSGRCSVEQERAQSHDSHRAPTTTTGDNPTISQRCRQDSNATPGTADVCPRFDGGGGRDGRWDDNHVTRVTAVTDDYFKTNLTDDEFLSENVNTACNLRRDKSKHRPLNCIGPDDHQRQASSSPHKSIDDAASGGRQDGFKNSWPDQHSHQMSFTDGEYIFGPYDERSEEFQHFNLWSSEFRQLRRNCHHHQQRRNAGGTSSSSSSGTTLVPPPHGATSLGSSCSCSIISGSSDTLREVDTEVKTPEWWQPGDRGKQVENYDDMPGSVPAASVAAGNVSPAATSYHRWVRFENGNIHPPSAPLTRVPTPYPSPTGSEADGGEEIFDRFAEEVRRGSCGGSPGDSFGGPVENVPLIDAVLDDLLTFSKSLEAGAAADEGRAAAKIVEINDDNLINLLADDDNAALGRPGTNEDSSKAVKAGKDSAGSEKSSPSKLGSSANSDDVVDGEKCDQNANEAGKRRPEDNHLNREDIFGNVAIFSWNPLDVYQQHGLFMIDPRFALADLHATAGCKTDDDDDAHPSPAMDDDTELTDGADPSSADVNSFATQRARRQDGILLLESHKIPNDSPPTVDHFYDSAHVEYPVRRPDCLSLNSSNATAKECHQSPPGPQPTSTTTVESDYDNDLAKKCNPQDEEGTYSTPWTCS